MRRATPCRPHTADAPVAPVSRAWLGSCADHMQPGQTTAPAQRSDKHKAELDDRKPYSLAIAQKNIKAVRAIEQAPLHHVSPRTVAATIFAHGLASLQYSEHKQSRLTPNQVHSIRFLAGGTPSHCPFRNIGGCILDDTRTHPKLPYRLPKLHCSTRYCTAYIRS